MHVAILGDTHVPSRATGLPDWVETEIEAADHVLFTGDFDSVEASEAVTDLAGDGFTAVHGNTDPPAIDLPETAVVTLGGVEFVLTHGTGAPHTWGTRVAGIVEDAGGDGAVGVAGHTHDPTDETVDGVRLLNPGSATGAEPASEQSMIRAEAVDGDLTVEFLEP